MSLVRLVVTKGGMSTHTNHNNRNHHHNNNNSHQWLRLRHQICSIVIIMFVNITSRSRFIYKIDSDFNIIMIVIQPTSG